MEHVTLDHERLRVVIDGRTGALRDITHRSAGLSLISEPATAARHPFAIVMVDGAIRRDWIACAIDAVAEQAHTVAIRWILDDDLQLSVQLSLDATSGELQCTVELRNPNKLPIAAVAYPYLAGIGRLGDAPDKDELVHPYATGFRVRNPLDTLPPVASETEGQQPVVLGLYPEGFSGSTMQFMAYSAVGSGGFYVATEDGGCRGKWLNFYRHPDGDLRLAIWHSPTDYADRRDVMPGYRTVLAPLGGGTWYDAADRYKAWALTQSWVARGPLWSRDDRPRWLFEAVGLCTFGINPRYNRVRWLSEIDRIAGTPVLHLLGPNWSKSGTDYMGTLPGGLADRFPVEFNQDNLDVIRHNGDYLIPFQFDLLFGRGEGLADAGAGAEALQVFPTVKLSRDAYDFPFLCPTSPFARELHVAHDRMLVEEAHVDGVYYDISLHNVRHICLSAAHGHEPGDTVALTTAYREMLAETAAAMRAAAVSGPSLRREAIPQGTEMINEQMIPVIAFYQARAEASPAAPFEAVPFRELIKRGVAEKIPLFAYVYHEYGPPRLDGWAKLSREQGDYVYFVLGRIFLQGGLIELNYEFSALEDVDGHSDTATEHYFLFDDRHYAIDPALAEFIGRLARARIGRANRYLAYGAMLKPAPLVIDGDQELALDYFLYNCAQTWSDYEDRGTMVVPAVLQVAWRYREESVAWLLLNLAPDARAVHLELTAPAIGPTASTWRLSRHQEGEASQELGHLNARRTVTLTLPSRCPVMIEAVPSSSDAATG